MRPDFYHGLFTLFVSLVLGACDTAKAPGRPPSPAGTLEGSIGQEWFTEAATAAGLNFVHFNGMSGKFYYPEIMAPGIALFDYDNDGDLDVYVVQGQMLGGAPMKNAVFPTNGALKDRLFRNDSVVGADGTRTLHFTDVTEASGIDLQSYGMGVAAGDFDNDGRVDLYRTGLNGSVMLRNNGDGTFTDATIGTRTENRGGWGISAAFVDYDRDGWLDLFVGNYLHYSVESDVHCLSVTGQRDYCPPNSYRAQPSRLYHNRGNGTFEDVTSRALVGGAYGPTLGITTADFNRDGWIDIYLANDGVPNLLWINQHDGTFKETAQLAGAAVNAAGNAESGMGVDAGDFDNDGDEDLFVTNWLSQMNTLYVNDGGGNFEERKAASGLGRPSLAKTGFGTAWFDFDNDGWLDLLTVNGGVATIEAQALAKDPFPLHMANQLYRNLRNGRFEDVSERAGRAFMLSDVGRGAAFGDLDNDGDTDVIVANAAGPLRLLVNHLGNQSHWLGLRLVSAQKRDALGARVEVVRAGQPTLYRRARADGSYASANDPRVLVGLGTSATPPIVRVTWPGGRMSELADAMIDRYITIRE
ncbi:MAG: CRTAC1 family protein [Acidobacteriota bacterium]